MVMGRWCVSAVTRGQLALVQPPVSGLCQVTIYLFCWQTKHIYLSYVIFTYCLLKTLIVEQKTFTLLTSLAAMPELCRSMTIAGHWSHFIWLFVSDLPRVNGHSCGLQGPATSVCIFWPALTLQLYSAMGEWSLSISLFTELNMGF